MGQKSLRRSHGWITALVVVPIGAVLFVLLYEAARCTIVISGISLAGDSFSQSAFKDAKRQLTAVNSIPPISDLLSGKGISMPTAIEDRLGGIFGSPEQMAPPLILLSELAASLISRSPHVIGDSLQELTQSPDFIRTVSTHGLEEDWKTIKVLSEDFKKNIDSFKKTRSRLPVSEADLNRYRERYLELRAKSLKLIRVPIGAEDASFGFYTKGVLAGLPLIGGIPDDQSLEQLRETLLKIRGSAYIPSDTPDPKKYFLSAVESIRTETRVFEELLDTLGITLTADSISRKEIGKSLQSDEALIISKLQAIFRVCTSK